MPAVKQVTLKNGLRLFLIEDKSLPTIDMRGMVYSGSVYEPAEKAGLAAITGEVLRSGGTEKLDGDRLDRELETMAASIETGIDDESATITVSMLKENLDRVLALTADILRRPVFAQEKIDLAKITQRTVISRRNDNIGAITNREFNKLIYGKQSPFSHQAEYASVDAISREDIVAFYKTYFHPDRMLPGRLGGFQHQADGPQDRDRSLATGRPFQRPGRNCPWSTTSSPVRSILSRRATSTSPKSCWAISAA